MTKCKHKQLLLLKPEELRDECGAYRCFIVGYSVQCTVVCTVVCVVWAQRSVREQERRLGDVVLVHVFIYMAV